MLTDDFISGWIRNAEKTGELKDNPYKGKEFDFSDYFATPKEHRLGMKILKDANCLPPAVELMQQIELKEKELRCADDPETKAALNKTLTELRLKRDLLL